MFAGQHPFVDDVSVLKMARNGTTQASSSGTVSIIYSKKYFENALNIANNNWRYRWT